MLSLFSVVDRNRWWRIATAVLVAVWLVAVLRLMIADVWDETNALVAFGSESWSTGEAVRFVFTQSMGIWRPLPSALAVVVIRGIGDPDVSWRVMRGLNVVLLLVALALLIRAMNRWSAPSAPRTTLFTLTFLYSSGAVITAGWFANLFDAWTLLFIAGGLLLMTQGRMIAAGLLFGVAFFFKETAALSLPLLLLLVAGGTVRWRDAAKTAVPATLLGALYFVLRSAIIPLGSAADTHGFPLADFLPTLNGLLESYWRQTMWGDGPGLLGYFWFLVGLAAMPGWRARAAYLLFVLATAAIYWQMFSLYQGGVLMHYLIFAGRLFLIPAALTLFVLALHGRTWALAILAVPLLFGAAATYVRYERFQRAYASIYAQAARSAEKPLRVHYPMKPLNDPRRELEIGDFPAARWEIETGTGRLIPRSAPARAPAPH